MIKTSYGERSRTSPKSRLTKNYQSEYSSQDIASNRQNESITLDPMRPITVETNRFSKIKSFKNISFMMFIKDLYLARSAYKNFYNKSSIAHEKAANVRK